MDDVSAAQLQRRWNILQFGVVPFDSPMQRPQQLAVHLAERHNLVYVEPLRSLVTALRQRTPSSHGGIQNPRAPFLRIHVPKPVLPASGVLPLLNRINYRQTVRSLKQSMQQQNLGSPDVLIVSFPKHVDVLDHFPGVRVVYDVMDDYPHFFPGRHGANLRRMHETLLERADAVVASSRTLAERCQKRCQNVTVVSNGVSEKFVRECQNCSPDLKFLEYPRPRIGYVGSLASWFDWQVIDRLAREFPNGSIILIGPQETAAPSLPSNVHLLGPRKHAELPPILRAFDIGLIPFQISELIDAVNPVKVYEYLAAGIAVAATPFREMQEFQQSAALCRTPEEWANAVRNAMLEPDAAALVARRHVAETNLWSQKATVFEKKLANHDSAARNVDP